MKRFIVILIMLMYGFSSSGITVQLHYCCGKLKNISWAASADHQCGMEKKMTSKKCCETKVISNSNDNHYNNTLFVFTSFETLYLAPVVYTQANVLQPQSISFFPITSNAPPLTEKIFILNCVFRN